MSLGLNLSPSQPFLLNCGNGPHPKWERGNGNGENVLGREFCRCSERATLWKEREGAEGGN